MCGFAGQLYACLIKQLSAYLIKQLCACLIKQLCAYLIEQLCTYLIEQLCAYLVKQQPEGPFCLSSKLAQAVSPLAGEQRDWCAAAVPAGACQGPGHQSLATSWSPVKQNAPACVANHQCRT